MATARADNSVTRHRRILVTAGLMFFLISIHHLEAQLPIPRGRPQLNAARTSFFADNGQPLRGPYTSTEWTSAAPYDQIAKIKDLGLNAVHLYAEVFDPNYPAAGSTAPGYNAAEVDKIVQRTRDLGLYLVMTIGNGANNGNHNLQWATNFWNFYAPRYANETHVLYEIHNEPMAWGPSYLTGTTPAGTLDMEIAAYRAIRAHAPHTPVLLFSYAVLSGSGGANAALTDIRAFNQAVFGNQNAVWTNEAVAFHGYGGWEGTATAVAALINAGYPCFMTEFGWPRWGTSRGVCLEVELTTDLERLGVSWLTFQYIPPSGVSDDVTRPELFKNVVDNAGLSWTPDYGTWPVARGVQGNNGQPRATVANWVNNVLTGTLRLQAEDFDWGGEGISYHDTDSSNSGGQYRTAEAVDIAACNDTGGGYAVTGTSDGEWLEYTILVREPGWYDLRLRYATPNRGCAVEVISNARDTTGARTLAPTGADTTWATATVPVYLGFGRQKLHLRISTGGFDLNWLELSPTATGVIANGTYRILNAANALAMEAVTSNNTVIASADSGTASQQWHVQHMGGGQYKITSALNGWSWNGSGSSLGLVSSWSTSDDRNFIPLPSGGGFQRFVIVSSGLCLNTSATNTAPVQKQEYSVGAPLQQWMPVATSAPAFPTALSAAASSPTQVTLTWNSVAGATSYQVKRSGSTGGPYTTLAAGVTATNYTDTGVAGVKYYYVVSAVCGGVEGANSLEASVQPPYPWASQDIGSVGVGGSVTFSNGVFTAGGSGADIWGTADAFRFVYLPLTGNGVITARVLSVQNTDGWAKAGVMMRASLSANSAHAFVAVTPGNGVAWQSRSTTGGNTSNNNTPGLNAPFWVRLVRSANTFTGYRSPDGVTWTQIGSAAITMGTTVYVGLALTSHNNSSLCTATFDNVTVPGWQNLTVPAMPTGLVASAGGGQVDLTWLASSNATSYNVKRAPTDGGAYVVVANVSTTNYSDTQLANGVAYCYVVSAANLAGESANSAPADVPGQVVAPSGLAATPVSATQVHLVWNAFTNATSYNVKRSLVSGGPYTPIAAGVTATHFTDTITPDTRYYYVVSAVVGGKETPNSAEATFDLPYPWLTQDVGAVAIAGSATFNNGAFAATASGDDIWNTADAFRFIYVPVTGNVVITARVLTLQNTDPWAKAGVMIRQSLTANSANALMAVTPGNGVTFQYRSTPGGNNNFTNSTGLGAPYWVRLVRSGNTFIAYRSPDGVAWTQQGTPVTISMASTVYAGLALTAHNNASLCAATFDNVSVPGWPVTLPPAAAPTGLTATAVSCLQVNLAWNASTHATSYNVKRSLTEGGPYTVITTGLATTNYSDYGLSSGQTYYYVVSAVNAGGESADSARAVATTLPLSLGALVHRYNFSETSGATVSDSIGGPAWNGTLPNGGAFAGGQLTLAPASSQHVSLPAGIVSILTNFTIEAWVRLNSTSNWSRIFDFGRNTTSNMFLTPQNGSSGRLRFAITTNGAGGEQQINGSSALATGVWHHVAVTLHGNTGILYLNGAAVGTNAAMTLRPSSLGFTENNYLGRSQYAADPYFDGLLNEFRLYVAALSADEIAATHALGPDQLLSTTPPQISIAASPDHLTLRWPLASAGYVLQSRTNLAQGDWMNVASPAPQILDGQWRVTLPPPTSATPIFYRLTK
jgi:fibronectin type 3 domain-containing protein